MPQQQLNQLENKLSSVFGKNAPFQIPANGKKSLAAALWWISLVVGLLQLWAAYGLWHAGHYVDSLNNALNQLSAYYGGPTTQNLGFTFYLALLVLVVDGALLLMAVSPLKAFKKAGWNLLFYSLLLNVAYGLARMFTDYGGFGDLVGALIGSVIGAYLLFQVRDFFKKA